MIIHYTVPEMWCVTDVIVIFHFRLFLPSSVPNSPKNQNLKNHIHVKKVGHTSNFFLAFIDETEKQIIIKKTVEVGQ